MGQVDESSLGKILVGRYGDDSLNFVGLCIGYCDSPTVIVELPDGSKTNWRADMCTVLVEDEQIAAMLVPHRAPQPPEAAK